MSETEMQARSCEIQGTAFIYVNNGGLYKSTFICNIEKSKRSKRERANPKHER